MLGCTAAETHVLVWTLGTSESAGTLASAASFPLLTGCKEWDSFVELLTSQPADHLQYAGQELWI